MEKKFINFAMKNLTPYQIGTLKIAYEIYNFVEQFENTKTEAFEILAESSGLSDVRVKAIYYNTMKLLK